MKSQAAQSKPSLAIKIGKRIRLIREKKMISVREFENYEDSVDRHQLSKIESGKILPSVYTLYKIARVLEVRVDEFFKDID